MAVSRKRSENPDAPAKVRRRRKPPKQVKIGYLDVPLNPKTDRWYKKNQCDGWFNTTLPEIAYWRSLPQDELVNTILHEILHGVVYVFDVKFESGRAEEAAVRKIANGLVTLLKDNPALLEWLKKSLKKP